MYFASKLGWVLEEKVETLFSRSYRLKANQVGYFQIPLLPLTRRDSGEPRDQFQSEWYNGRGGLGETQIHIPVQSWSLMGNRELVTISNPAYPTGLLWGENWGTIYAALSSLEERWGMNEIPWLQSRIGKVIGIQIIWALAGVGY